MKILMLLILTFNLYAQDNTSKTKVESKELKTKQDVLENPTLKTLSGSLNKYSLYSSFTYRGASLSEPLGAERPNILNAEETPGLVDMSGNFGIKYRATKSDNFSLQTGLYSTTPFHNSIDTDNSRNANDYAENGQEYDVDDPTLSYFKTYYLGGLQNITFLKYQYVTRGIYRDYGLRYATSLSHAAAYKINKAMYIAASLNYINYQYDSKTAKYFGREINIVDRQTSDTLRANLSTEFYVRRNISFRLITDLASYFRMRESAEVEERDLQQTMAMTYFFNRDISIAPNIRFIADDIRSDRTNIGLTMNINI